MEHVLHAITPPTKWYRLSHHYRLFIFVSLYALFVLFTSYNQLGSFSIPDERAVHWQIDRVMKTGLPTAPEPLSDLSQELIHPRSLTIYNSTLVPEGFIGYGLLIGWLSRVVGTDSTIVIHTILLILAALCLSLLWTMQQASRRMDHTVVILTLLYPSILYYSVHPYSPNLASTSLFIISLTLLLIPLRHAHSTSGWIIQSLWLPTLVLSMLIRPSEAGWMFLTLVGVWIWFTPKLSPRQWVSGLLLASIPLIALGYAQQQIYGAWWLNNYILQEIHARATQPLGQATAFSNTLIAPFGISPIISMIHLYQYCILLVGPIVWLSFLGLNRLRGMHIPRRSVALFFGAFFWLVLLYGSWEIRENTDASIHTLSTSYVRYWFPISILMILFARSGLERLKSAVGGWRSSLMLMLVIFSSVLQVSIASPANLFQTYRDLAFQKQRREWINRVTPENAIILVKYSDKAYFPQRRVVVWYREPQKVLRALPSLSQNAPIYIDEVLSEGKQLSIPTHAMQDPAIIFSPEEVLRKIEFRSAIQEAR